MLPLLDPQVRLMLLSHIVIRLGEADQGEVRSTGIEAEQLTRLRGLSPIELSRLAGMRELTIAVRVDSGALNAGLRAVTLANEAKAMEDYFIRHGASWQMMNALFKIRRKLTLKRRRDCGAWRPSGRLPLPDPVTRERIFRGWLGVKDTPPRERYFRLHGMFPTFNIAVLEAVVRQFEADA